MTDYILIPSNPAPAGSTFSMFTAGDGVTLRYGLFPAPNPRGTVILQAGRSEFIEKYFEVIGDLHARGLSVATMDWRGQGLSSRQLPDHKKGHVADFDEFKSDLKYFFEEIVVPKFDGPYFLLTHSMGGMPALMLLAEGYDRFARTVLCAPMTNFHVSPIESAIGRMAAKIACLVGRSGDIVLGIKEYSLEFEGNALTSDETRHTRFRDIQNAAPQACIESPTYGWLDAAVRAIDQIHKPGALSEIKTPVLIVSAEKELLVSTPDQIALASQYDMISQITIKDALHEIMMERDVFREQFWTAVDEFFAPVLLNA